MGTPHLNSNVLDDWTVWLTEELRTAVSAGEDSVPLSSFVNCLEAAARESGQSNLGWLVGRHGNYLSRGVLGRAVTGAGTLGAGLNVLTRFYPLIQDATYIRFEVIDDLAVLSYKILDPSIWPREQDALYTLGILSTLLQQASKDIWPQVRVSVEAPKSARNADLSRILHAPVTYGAQANEIMFPARFIHTPFKGSEPILFDEIRQLAQSLSRKNRNMPFIDRARYVIFAALFDTNISQDVVARELGLSTRTLRRKLAQEGASYQQLLDDCRMEIAARELAIEKHVSLSQMALKLGYSEHSTFTRAFFRWAGMTPKRYRGMATQQQQLA